MPETQIATQRKSVHALLEQYKSQFALALPKLLTPERFTRVALTAINKNPKLVQCTQESLLACLLDCASLGIEPDGRRAHLIPYGDKCTLILDYKGIAELVRRSGEISTLHCGIVYPSDDFDYAFGTGQFLKHKPTINPREEAEKPLCVYSYVKLKDGQEDFDVMSIADVQKVRKRSRAATNGPWVTDFDEMAKKTVFRRHSKWLPLSPELRDKIEKDDEPLTEQERFASAKPVDGIEFGPATPPEQPEAPAAEPEPKRTSKKAAKEDKPEPPRATPLEGLRNLMAGSKIEEKDIMTELFSLQKCGQIKFEELPEETVAWVIANWAEIVSNIRGE